MRSTIEILRGAASLALFGVFGLGALLISPIMPLLRRPELGQPVVRATWRPLVWLFVHTGLIAVDARELPRYRGTVIAANHPSFIDIVLMTVLLPKSLYVAKAELRRNWFMAAIVRATSLPQDATLVDRAGRYLRRGWNLIVFPEGTRSPADGSLGEFHRGAAQVALRAPAPLACVGIGLSYRILGKGQPPWDMGPRRVIYTFRGEPAAPATALPGESVHAAARRLTGRMRERISALA